MAHYFARVELHEVEEWEDDVYTLLHEAMDEIGFIKTIPNAKKKLPSGTYILPNGSDRSAKEVRGRISSAAKKTGRDYTIVVVKFKSWEDIAGMGLKDVEE